MTIPADFTKSVWSSLASTRNELRDLLHITDESEETYQALDQALSKLGDVLSKCIYESWTEKEANLALQSLADASVKTSSLVSKWTKRRIRLVLDKSTFVDELSDAVTEIQESCGQLQARQNHKEAAIAIGEQLNTVVQGLRDGELGNRAEAQLKEKSVPLKQLLDFVRSNHSKSKTSEDADSLVTWLARHLRTDDIHSIEQDLQEMKENADTLLNAQRDMGTELLEQLILSLNELERQSVTLASTKANLICTLCDSQMICPVMIDSGLSFCKACIEERFSYGSMTCPDTHLIVNKSFVVNVTLQNVVACFGEAEEQPAAESSQYFTEDEESSDASLSHRELNDGHVADESLDGKAQLGLKDLDSSSKISVQRGVRNLIECASSPGGRLAVLNAEYTQPPSDSPKKVIPTLLAKVKTQDSRYSHLAVKLLAALMSSKGGASQNSREPDIGVIFKDDALEDALDFIVSLMNDEVSVKTRVRAAEALANILVTEEVRDFVRSKEGIVPSLVALSNADIADIASPKRREKANSVGLKGLQRLSKCFRRGDKTKKIVSALIILLKKGLNCQPELEILVRGSLVALDNQVLAMDLGTSTSEVCKVVWKERKDLMAIKGVSVSHTSEPGRMAIINIMTKLCGLYKNDIDEHVFLYLLKMIKYTRAEIESLSEPSSQSPLPQEGIEAEKLKNLTELVNRSVRLLCFCVTHVTRGQSTAQPVLKKNVEEGRSTLEELLVHGETSGISDESRLEILSILEQVGWLSTQAVTILIKSSQSKNQNCRQQVARKLRTLVERGQHLTEFEQAEGIAALLLLLEDPNLNCRQDALVALQALPSKAIPVGQLPLESILYFLIRKGPNDVTNAAIGLFDLMVKGKAVRVDKFLESEGALEALLRLSDTDTDSPGSQKSASALLVMAKADQSIRTRIAEHRLRGLDILVKYVWNLGNNEVKELLTATLVLLCRDGKTYQEAVIEADGHMFLISSLKEKISKEEAARGLLELIQNTCTIEIVRDGGFVATALRSVDRRFACIDIARGLDRISSIQEGLNQICSDSSSVSALLILLEHCPDCSGKNAAALIISRLYPLLHHKEDSTRCERIIDKCQLLLDHLDPFDPEHVNGFLQALAALAAEPEGRKMIHQSKGLVTLSNHFSGTDTEIQGLLLKILSEMSSDISENGVENYSAKMISIAFMEIGVGKKVFKLLRSDEFCRRTESMKDALILIRNLSLAASDASSQLVEQGAVSVLLEVLKRHERFLPIVTELALKALEKVLDDSEGKKALIKGGGIKTLVAIVKIDALERAGDAFGRANVATIILIKVASDPHSRRVHAIETIFDGDILTALKNIIFNGQPDKVKWQAAVLMKLLAKYGPSPGVFVAIKEKNCLDALIYLRSVTDCKAAANDALNYVSKKNKACRNYIQNPH